MTTAFASRMRPLLITLLFAYWATGAATGADSPPAFRIPLLYCSDLFHPHDDPDDHFDLATLYAIPEFDVRGIVLDQGALQVSRPGSIPVAQLNALTGRNIPTAIGLASKLASPTDPGRDQPDQFQGGVRLILDTLRAATRRVDIIAVGSMRDLAAAFNREPELFRQRAGRLLLFIGEASEPGFREHNVGLDPHAFVGLMRSGLDIYWVPCFDGGLWRNAGHASFWQATHAELLHRAPPALVQFFIYALDKETTDPLAFLRQPVDPARRAALFGQTRNLWCTAVFQALTVPGKPAGNAFEFESVNVAIGDDGVVRAPAGVDSTTVHRFKVRDLSAFGTEMTRATAEILGRAADPDFGPNVLLFDPGQPAMQERIDTVFQQQERAQFGRGRHAILFKPGTYDLDVPVGFYTHVAGLGSVPGDVTIRGQVWTDAAWMNRNATCNFWRTVENLTVVPTNGVNIWAVSQAAPLRRTHIRGDLQLWSGGWSSGGFMADCRIDGTVKAGSQQQWFARNSSWNTWLGVNWNMVFVGCENPPPGDWPDPAVTRIANTPLVREKPYLALEHGFWFVKVPPLRQEPTSGVSWISPDTQTRALPIESFHIAKADTDTAATINAALRDGRHLLLTPGIYALDDTIVVPHPNTIVFGLGFPTLVPVTGKTALRVETDEGVVVSGLMLDASPSETETLVQFGMPGRGLDRAENPICVHDLVCRVGGYGAGKAKTMVTIHAHQLLGDNFWLWRADHGAHVGWTENTCDTGLLVEGHDVTIYGLFVEHTQKYQTLWRGDRGRVYFYQSEMPYDPPSQEAWRSADGDGFASYKVDDSVKTHDAWGIGVYHVFQKAVVIADNAIETPEVPGIRPRHLFTFRLGGGKPGSGIRHVINGRGGETIQSQKATVK